MSRPRPMNPPTSNARWAAARGLPTAIFGLVTACGAGAPISPRVDEPGDPSPPIVELRDAGPVTGDARSPGRSADAAAASPRDVDPMAACALDRRNVFSFVVDGQPGPYEAGEWTMTNLDSQWEALINRGLEVSATRGDGFGIGVTLSTATSTVPSLGAHTISRNGDGLDLVIGASGCSLSRGSYVLRSLDTSESDAGSTSVSAASLSFDGWCDEGSDRVMRIRGCARYAESL